MTEKQHQCQSHCKHGLQTTSTSVETHKTTRPSMRGAPGSLAIERNSWFPLYEWWFSIANYWFTRGEVECPLLVEGNWNAHCLESPEALCWFFADFLAYGHCPCILYDPAISCDSAEFAPQWLVYVGVLQGLQRRPALGILGICIHPIGLSDWTKVMLTWRISTYFDTEINRFVWHRLRSGF